MTVQEQETRIPEWLADMEFCHIDDGSERRSMCGLEDDGTSMCPVFYTGLALCEHCGNPTCPRCAQLMALEDSLEAEDAD